MSDIYFKEVCRIAVVSTAYVTERDRELMLEPDAPNKNMQHLDDVATMFWIPTNRLFLNQDIEGMQDYGFSEQFIKMFRAAYSQNLSYIMFDIDGGQIEGMKETNT